MISGMSTDKNIYWATFRNQTEHEMYVEIEDLGRNRWSIVVGTDEFILRCPSKDFMTVLRAALEEADARRGQTS